MARARAIAGTADPAHRPHVASSRIEGAAAIARSIQRLYRQQQARERVRMRNRQIDVDMAAQMPLPDEHDEL